MLAVGAAALAIRVDASTAASVKVEKPTRQNMESVVPACTANPSAGAIGHASDGTTSRATASPGTVHNTAAATAHATTSVVETKAIYPISQAMRTIAVADCRLP